jgi:hypothetical protein
MYYLNRKVDYKKHALSKKKTQSVHVYSFKMAELNRFYWPTLPISVK